MSAIAEQLIIPIPVQPQGIAESMTFNTSLERKQFIQLERSKGYEVFLNYIGSRGNNKELYAITRRVLA